MNNLVDWSRPFNSYTDEEIQANYDKIHQIQNEVTNFLKRNSKSLGIKYEESKPIVFEKDLLSYTDEEIQANYDKIHQIRCKIYEKMKK